MKQNSVSTFITNKNLTDDLKRQAIAFMRLSKRGREDITVFATEMLGLPLNEFQKRYLLQTTTPREMLRDQEFVQSLNEQLGEDLFKFYSGDVEGMKFGKNIAFPSNQVGKTVMIAIKHLWFNYYKIGLDLSADIFDKAYFATLNISPASRQVKACIRYTMSILNQEFVIEEGGRSRINQLHPLMQGFFKSYNSTLGEIRFANGSIFYSVPVGHDQASSLAGGQFAYISYDECAQSGHLENELGAKVLSRLIKYGVALDLISTAEVDAPSHQYYHRIVQLGLQCKEGWWSMGGSLDQNIFIPERQREQIKADLFATDKKKYRQVVFGEFVTGGKRFFEQSEIDNLWKLPGRKTMIPGHKYLLVADWGMADTGDPSEFAVFDHTTFAENRRIEIVAWETTQGGTPHMQFAILKALYDEFTEYGEDGITVTPPQFLMDANALGGVVIKKLLSALKPKGFSMDKDEALLILKTEMGAGRDYYETEDGQVIERFPVFGNIATFFQQGLADQLGMYHLDDKKLTQDKVMTLMMGVAHIAKKFPRTGKPLSEVNLSGMRTWSRTVRPMHTVRHIKTL